MDSKIIIVIAIVVSAMSTVGIMYLAGFEQQSEIIREQSPPEIVNLEKQASEYFGGTHDIKKIASQEELKNILETSAALLEEKVIAAQTTGSASRTTGDQWTLEEALVLQSERIQQAEFSDASGSGTEYSTTNVQVANVDEPDYLKNDSKYVYIVRENTLSIIDAYPAEDASLILKIALDVESSYIQNMFLNEDRLVIFYNGQKHEETIKPYDFVPQRSYSPATHALIIDVSDREDPVILKDYSIDGHFSDARMIGDYAYFVTSSRIDQHNPRLPIILEGSIPIMTPDAFYFDNVEEFSNFNTLTAIDIFGDTVNSETFLMGNSRAFYVSEDNFYLTYEQNTQKTQLLSHESIVRDRFFDAIVPQLPESIQNEIKTIQDDSSLNSAAQWMKISGLMQESYNKMDKDDKEELFTTIKKALHEYDLKSQEDTRKTIIHKISIDEDKIEYIAKGTVPGRLLNQFSMDQNGDRFRIATTVEYHTQYQGLIRANAVHILDEQLNIVGELGNIAPDESIFSARFIGDRLYLVTFQQIDPFFVIGLSADTPKILGELKIPGFSNYLHPYDEEHIIGIGRDTDAANGRVTQLGVKIALFNVADVSNPKVADEIVIGSSRTHSDALYDHRAFFFDKTREILSIPISGNAKDLSEASGHVRGTDDNWSGFYVFDLDDTVGFNLKGTINHSDENSNYYKPDSPRTFYIDDVLYTATDLYLKMNSFESLEEINSIKLEKTGKFIKYLE